MARTPIYAAGGIVVRGGSKRPLVAVVQRSKDERWVLPRGKLKRDEDPVAGARREVVEETGHRVRVHEFLGAITYRARGRPKLVQFWRMQAYERPSRDVMSDIVAVEWLPLAAAVRRLSYPLEKLFLHHAGRRALKRRKRIAAKRKSGRPRARRAKWRRAQDENGAGARTRARPRAHARKASAPRARSRARKIARRQSARTRRAAARRKRRATAPVRIAAAKQAIPTKISSPAQSPPRAPAAAPAKRPTVLARMLGRLRALTRACRIAAASLAEI